MPEQTVADRVCPYLRGRQQSQPFLVPSDENHCLVTAFIHLPHPQQTRFCLGGQYENCSRFQRQQQRPLPTYVTGVPPAPVLLSPPPPPLTPVFWRRPWFRSLLQMLLLALLLALVVWGWRWQQSEVRARITPPPLTTPVSLPHQSPHTPFDAPIYSAPAP